MEVVDSQKSIYGVKIGDTCLNDLDIISANHGQITIYSLFEHKFAFASSKLLLKSQLMNPTWNYDQLNKQQDDLSYVSSCLQTQHTQLKKHFRQLNPLQQVLKQFQSYTSSYEPWKRLMKTLCKIEEIVQILRSKQDNDSIHKKPQFIQILEDIDIGQLQSINHQIMVCLEPSELNSIQIKEGINQELDTLKNTQKNISVILQNHLENYLVQLQSQQIILPDLNFSIVKYQVQGFLLKVIVSEQNYGMLQNFNFEQIDWCFTLQDGEDLYFSNSLTTFLNDQYLNNEDEILILEQKIIIEINNQIIQCEPFFNQIEQQLTLLDYNISLCQLMDEYQLTIPDIVKEPVCEIVGGRHLLSEQALLKKQTNHNSFIQNNFQSSDKRITLITGPNYSGKSVFIKQVSIVVFLSHAGIPVPATYAKIGLVDQIQTLFAGETQKSINQRQIDSELIQLGQITKTFTNRTFILFDELGKNFKFDIGSALFSSTVLYLQNYSKQSPIEQVYQCKAKAPFIMAATHYHAVLKNDFRGELGVQFAEMQVLLSENIQQDLVFQYKILFKLQLSESSLALEVARNLMNDEQFFQRSKEILNTLVKRLRADDYDQGD